MLKEYIRFILESNNFEEHEEFLWDYFIENYSGSGVFEEEVLSKQKLPLSVLLKIAKNHNEKGNILELVYKSSKSRFNIVLAIALYENPNTPEGIKKELLDNEAIRTSLGFYSQTDGITGEELKFISKYLNQRGFRNSPTGLPDYISLTNKEIEPHTIIRISFLEDISHPMGKEIYNIRNISGAMRISALGGWSRFFNKHKNSPQGTTSYNSIYSFKEAFYAIRKIVNILEYESRRRNIINKVEKFTKELIDKSFTLTKTKNNSGSNTFYNFTKELVYSNKIKKQKNKISLDFNSGDYLETIDFYYFRKGVEHQTGIVNVDEMSGDLDFEIIKNKIIDEYKNFLSKIKAVAK